MCEAAILGAGPIGAAVAERLVSRGRLKRILLIDAAIDAATGIALDLQQSGAVAALGDTTVSAADDLLAAARADVIVVADRRTEGEWAGPDGVGLVQRLVRAGISAPMVFAGPSQHQLMEAAYRRLGVPRDRLIGTAAAALAGTVQEILALELDAPCAVIVTGRPPQFVIGWSAATAGGRLVREHLPPHQLLATTDLLGRLWPPGPYAIASATAPVVEALGDGSRRRHLAVTILDGELNTRGSAVLLPVALDRGRVRSHALPSLSEHERTALLNSLLE